MDRTPFWSPYLDLSTTMSLTMNEKLVRRAARKYRDWLVSQTQSPVMHQKIYVLNLVHMANSRALQIEKWAERFFRGANQRVQKSEWDNEPHMGIMCPSAYEKIVTRMIPELGEDVINSIRQTTETLRSLAIQEVITVISPKESIDEIRAIADAWENVKFKENILSVLVEDVTLEDDCQDVSLGSFWINLNLTCPLSDLKIESVDCVESENGFTHPHVSRGGGLCMGEGGHLSQEALCQGRLEDYFRIIEAVLRTYNESSPYEKLQEWYDPSHEDEFYCENCNEWRSDESNVYCEGCQTTYCDHCAECSCCSECGNWYCDECSTSCESCQETICTECAKSCSVCSNTMCSECLEQCVVCDSHYCEECKTTCSECNKTVCKDCNDNSCEHCGVPSCPSCLEKHNCLLVELKR